MFLQWLSAINFSGGGFDDAAVAEGLDTALMMFSSLNGSETQENADGRRHCLLVGASNPHPLPIAINCPAIQKLEQSRNTEAHTSNRLADAETIAKAFPQCSVSLSVICPRKLPKLRAIYNAGKHDPQAADPPVDTSKNPNFLVLISENFSEACAALSRTEMASLAPNQSVVEMAMSSVPPVSGPAATSSPAAMNHQQISAGYVPAVTLKIEPTIVSVSGPAPPDIPTARPASQLASPISVSPQMVPNNENTKETTPIVSVMTQSLRPSSGAAANVRILNEVASAIPAAPAVLSSGQLGVTSMTGFAPFAGTGQITPNSIPASLTSMSGFAGFAGTGHMAQDSVPASLTLMAPSGNLNLCMSQLLSTIQGGIDATSQTSPVMSQGNLPVSEMMQSGIGIHQNVPIGSGTMMPTPGMTQQGQPGMLPLGRNNSTEASMSSSQQQTSVILPSTQSNYAKIWEGNLSVLREGQLVRIARLAGYNRASASESFAANWPPTMQISQVVSKDRVDELWHAGMADRLVFRATEQHGLIHQLQEKKLSAVVQLPSQTLCLSVDRADRLIGTFFPREQRPLPQLQQQQPHRLQLKQQEPLSVLQQQQQQSLQQLPHQQHLRTSLKRQVDVPILHQAKVSRIHQQTAQTQQQQQVLQLQQIEQQQPLIGTAVNQAYMQGTDGRSQLMSQTQASSQGQPSIPEGDLLIEHDDELDTLLNEHGEELDNAIADILNSGI